MRGLGLACLATAVAVVHEAARRAFGAASGWASGLALALCPTAIVAAAEIRAYPLFVLESAVAFRCLTRLTDPARPPARGDAPGLTLALIAAVLTHFFGLVLAAGRVGGPRPGGRPGPAFVEAGFRSGRGYVAVAAVVVLPFVAGALAISAHPRAPAPLARRLHDIQGLLNSVTSHPSLSLSTATRLGASVGFWVLSGLTLVVAIFGRAGPGGGRHGRRGRAWAYGDGEVRLHGV